MKIFRMIMVFFASFLYASAELKSEKPEMINEVKERSTIENYLICEQWSGLSGVRESDSLPFVLRFRIPVLEASEIKPYTKLVTVFWAYDKAHTGSMPDEKTGDEMAEFEQRLYEVWEKNSVAVLTAVLTFDGARQWVYYTKDVKKCAASQYDVTK